MKFRLKKIDAAAWAVIGLFLAVSLWRLSDFGYGNDEQWLFKRGDLTARIISDVFSGQGPSLHVLQQGEGDWIYHPSFYSLLNYHGLSSVFTSLGFSVLASVHFLNVLMAAGALTGLFYWGKKSVGPRAALAAVCLLASYPRFIGHAQYNPKDIPLMAFAIGCYYFAEDFFHSKRGRSLWGAGIFLGLALATHLSGLVLLPIFFGGALLTRGFKKALSATFLIGLIAGGVLLLFWPSLWLDPTWIKESIGYFSGPFDRREVVYFGSVYRRDTLPWTYIPFYLFASTPLLVVGFFLAGALRLRHAAHFPRKFRLHGFLLLAALLPVLIRLIPGVVKYNGIRHAWIAVPPLILYAGWGAVVLTHALRRRFKRISAGWLLIPLAAYSLFQIIPLHPHEGDYFNEAVRWIYPKNLNEKFEFPCWATPFKEGIDWLNQNAEPGSTVWIPQALNVSQLYSFRDDLTVQKEKREGYALLLGSDRNNLQLFEGQTPDFELKRYHSLLAAVFRIPPSLRK